MIAALARLGEAPRAALWPGLGGLVPFVGLAAALWTAPAEFHDGARAALLVYAAVILAFVGAIHWGVAVGRAARDGTGGGAHDAAAYRWSVVPALAGWSALLLAQPLALVVLAAAFACQLAADRRLVARHALPGWFLPLRALLTAWAVAALLAALVATLAAARAGS